MQHAPVPTLLQHAIVAAGHQYTARRGLMECIRARAREKNTTGAFQKRADSSASPVVVCLKQWAGEQPHWRDEVDSTGQHARQLSVLDTSDGMSMADACLAYVREVFASCAVQLKLQSETYAAFRIECCRSTLRACCPAHEAGALRNSAPATPQHATLSHVRKHVANDAVDYYFVHKLVSAHLSKLIQPATT
jgi:hypothetical protein